MSQGALISIFSPEPISGAYVFYMYISAWLNHQENASIILEGCKNVRVQCTWCGGAFALQWINACEDESRWTRTLSSLPRNLCISRSLRCANVDSFLSPITTFATDALSFLFPRLSIQLTKLLRLLFRCWKRFQRKIRRTPDTLSICDNSPRPGCTL